MNGIYLLLFSFLLVFVVHTLIARQKAQQAVGYHPGRTFLLPANALSHLLPHVPYLNLGNNWGFLEKHDEFARGESDVQTITSLLPPKVDLIVADPLTVKEITTSRARFPKPVEYYDALAFFGRNIIVSEGGEWKKYRKVSAPAFSDRNNELVWDEAMQITLDMMDQVWKNRDAIHVDHVLDVTLPIALFVIGVAGFGKRVSWEDEKAPVGHKMTLKRALHVATTNFIIKLALPTWALGLTERFRLVRDSFDELKQHMKEMILERQNSSEAARHDLLSKLLEANNCEDAAASLTEDEIIGNIFVFLVAGHETSAHSLAFTFALLALHPDEQDKLYEEVRSLMSDGRKPSYDEMPKFIYSMAVFNETLRMFPPLSFPKGVAEDTTLTTIGSDGQCTTVPVPKGTFITVSVPAVHYNPRYWKDPHSFKPERFLEDWPRDAFVPFSAGARACIGRKFFETEAIATLVTIISKYKVSVKEEPQYVHETFEQRKARILRTHYLFTMTPDRIPLTFTRRA